MDLPREPRPPPQPQCDEITPCLYLGNLVAAESTEYLVSRGITHVLTLTSQRLAIPAEAGIVHKQFRVRDTRRQNLLQYLLDGVEFIENSFLGVIPPVAVTASHRNPLGPPLPTLAEPTLAEPTPAEPTLQPTPRPTLALEREVKVFVHCRAGISRSGSVVVAYVMKNYGMDFAAALALVRAKRPIVNPNHAFVSQLHLLQSSNFDLSLLGPEVLNQAIENPYDPDEFPEDAARRESGRHSHGHGHSHRRHRDRDRDRDRRRSRGEAPLVLPPLMPPPDRPLHAWEREPDLWTGTAFASDVDRTRFEQCLRRLRSETLLPATAGPAPLSPPSAPPPALPSPRAPADSRGRGPGGSGGADGADDARGLGEGADRADRAGGPGLPGGGGGEDQVR